MKRKGLDSLSSRIRRWIVNLQELTFSADCIPWIRNRAADCLSRFVDCEMCENNDVESKEEDETAPTSVYVVTDGRISEHEWKKELEGDETLAKMRQSIINGWTHHNKN